MVSVGKEGEGKGGEERHIPQPVLHARTRPSAELGMKCSFSSQRLPFEWKDQKIDPAMTTNLHFQQTRNLAGSWNSGPLAPFEVVMSKSSIPPLL